MSGQERTVEAGHQIPVGGSQVEREAEREGRCERTSGNSRRVCHAERGPEDTEDTHVAE